MDLTLSDDQLEVRSTYARLFDRESSLQQLRAVENSDMNRGLWKLVVELGTIGIAVDPSHGGAGAGLLDVAMVAEEQGRRLASIPLIESIVAARLLASFDHPRASAVVDGDSIGTLAVRPAEGGSVRRVPAGAVADVVVAMQDDVLVAFEFDGGAGRLPNLASLPIADIEVPKDHTVLAEGRAAASAFRVACAEWHALAASFLAGIAAEALTIGVEYVKQRKQFGVPIGSFQTVAHRLADCACAVDGARLLAQESAWAVDERRAGAPNLAAAALHHAGRVAQHVAAESLHFHGGYGFMLEYDIQLYYRWAKAWSLLTGDPEELLDHVAPLAFEEVR